MKIKFQNEIKKENKNEIKIKKKLFDFLFFN